MFAIAAVLIGAESVLAAFGAPMRLIFIIDEVVCVVVADEDDVAAATAIATIGAAPRFVLLAAKANATATAVSGLEFYYTLVDKHARHDAERPPFAKGRICKLLNSCSPTIG
jgi:hypothetical protein